MPHLYKNLQYHGRNRKPVPDDKKRKMTTRHFSCVVLLLTLAAAVAAHTSLSVGRDCVYTLFVKTGDVSKAGTDSKIDLTLGDFYGQTFKITNLEKWGLMSKEHDYFERDTLDIFAGRSKCLNLPICKLKLESNVKGQSPGWYVEYIEVTVTRPHEKCSQSTFPIKKWVGVDGPDLTVILESCKNYVA